MAPRETTGIPCDGTLAWVGAAAYLATLAYPEDTAKRDHFIRHVAATRARQWVAAGGTWDDVPESLRIRKDKLYAKGPFGPCLARIVGARIAAAYMGRELIGRVDFESTRRDPGAAWLGQRSARPALTLKIVPTIDGKPATVNTLAEHAVTRGFHASRTNVITRIWSPSKPVLHLAIALLDRIAELDNVVDLPALIGDPVWVRAAVGNAELLRIHITRSPYIGITDEQTIRLLPKQ